VLPSPASGLGNTVRLVRKPSGVEVPSRPISSAQALPAVFGQLSAAFTASPWLTAASMVGATLVLIWGLQAAFRSGSRKYAGNVGEEYDAWTDEGILEYYWGEHIHLGFYTKAEREKGYLKKNFIQAKYDFVDRMLDFAFQGKSLANGQGPPKVLDVGCGIGGTTRHLAAKFPESQLTGITLSPKQVGRATELAKERKLENVNFRVMDALNMEFEANTFDLVWGCESGEHMPDKKKYVEEMIRVLKPGGTLVIACWCQREEGNRPFTNLERDELQFLYDEWAHPYFISKEEFGRLARGTGVMTDVVEEDWCRDTIDSWRHSIWVGVFDPWIVIWKGLTKGPQIWWKVIREIVTLERMHRAFDKGLMEYGMIRATKRA